MAQRCEQVQSVVYLEISPLQRVHLQADEIDESVVGVIE